MAQQNYAARPVTRLSDSTSGVSDMTDMYASMLSLPRTEFIEKLKVGHFLEIQGFCKAIKISAKGARTELECRLMEYKEQHDARVVPSVNPSTPERRDGRKRSPHRGDTFAWPTVVPLPSHDRMDESAPLPDAAYTMQDPLLQSDPWKTYMLSTPKTRRSDAAHSGLTPTLESKFQKLDEF